MFLTVPAYSHNNLCMRGSIYSCQKCPVCGKSFIYRERKGYLFCPAHPDQRATGSFYVKFGRSIRKRFKDFAEAERFLIGVRYEVDRGTFDHRDYNHNAPLGLANLASQWLAIKQNEVKPRSFSNLNRYMQSAIDAWQQKNIKTIGYAEIEDFLQSQKVSDKTKSNIRSCLHTFWTWLKKRQVITSQHFPNFPEIKYQLGFRKIIDKETQKSIIDEVKRISFHINPKIWLGIKWLATYIAIRPGELIKLRERDIDYRLGYFIVLHTKEGKEKLVPMLEEDKELLRSLPTGLPELSFFRHPGGISGCRLGEPFGPRYLYKWWKKACENLGVKGVDLYGGTRHSSATALREFLSPEQIKLGTMHSTNKAFERYFQAGSEDALRVFHLTAGAPPAHHQKSRSKSGKLLKYK